MCFDRLRQGFSGLCCLHSNNRRDNTTLSDWQASICSTFSFEIVLNSLKLGLAPWVSVLSILIQLFVVGIVPSQCFDQRDCSRNPLLDRLGLPPSSRWLGESYVNLHSCFASVCYPQVISLIQIAISTPHLRFYYLSHLMWALHERRCVCFQVVNFALLCSLKHFPNTYCAVSLVYSELKTIRCWSRLQRVMRSWNPNLFLN